MDFFLRQLIKEAGFNYIFVDDLHGDGYLVGNTIVIKNGLSDEKIEQVIYHELEHRNDTQVICEDYKHDYKVRIVSENNAQTYMIDRMLLKYLKFGYELSTLNYVDFANQIGVKDIGMVKRELLKYINQPPSLDDGTRL